MRSILLLVTSLFATLVGTAQPTPFLEYKFTNESLASTGSNATQMGVLGSVQSGTGVDGDARGSFYFCCGSLGFTPPTSLRGFNMTVVMKVKFEGNTPRSNKSFLFDTRQNLTNNPTGYYAYYDHAGKMLVFGDRSTMLTASATLLNGTWYEIAFTNNANTSRRAIHLDGVRLTPARSFYNSSQSHTYWRFGNSANANVSSELLAGYMDDLTIYSPALSSGEVGGLVTGDFTPPTPPTNLTLTASTSSSVDIAFDAATDNVGVVEYLAEVIGSAEVSLGTALTGSFLDLEPSTEYFINVWAVDLSGNESTKTRLLVMTADGTPPTIPTGLRVTSVTATGIEVAFQASTDNISVDEYRAQISGQAEMSLGTALTASFTGLPDATAHTITVWAVDGSGNTSPKASISANTADGTPPSAPSRLVVTTLTHDELRFSFDRSRDNVEVVDYLYALDGAAVVSLNNRPFGNLSGLTPGKTYDLKVYAVDAMGNRSQPASLSVTMRTNTLAPPLNLTVQSVTAEEVVIGFVRSTDDDGNSNYLYYQDGVVTASATLGNQTPRATFGELTPNTTYTFGIRVRNSLKDVSPIVELTVTTPDVPDTQAPTAVSNLRVVSVTTTEAEVAFEAATDDRELGSHYYTVNRGGAVALPMGSTRFLLSQLTPATTYSLEVYALDAAGNAGPRTPLTVNTLETPDTQAPTAPGNLRVTDQQATALTLAFDAATDNRGVVGYMFSRDGGTPLSLGLRLDTTITGLTPNTSYTFSAYAVDAAGNQSTEAQLTARTARASSVTESGIDGFGVSPNPVAGSTVSLSGLGPQDEVTVVDVRGQVVYQSFGPHLEASSLIAGIYILRVQTMDGRFASAKLVRQ